VAFAVADVFLRINGYSISGNPRKFHEFLIDLFESGNLEMAHLVPWLQAIVQPRR
jgi:death-on-curing protein